MGTELMASSEQSSEVSRFMAALYKTDVKFSYLPGFAAQVIEKIASQAATATDLISIISNAENTVARNEPLVNAEQVRRHVEMQDLLAIAKTLTDSKQLATTDFSEGFVKTEVQSACLMAVDILHGYGTWLGDAPEVFVVERMPEPHGDKKHAAAMVFDREDEKEFGTPEGIYFNRSHLAPYYSQFIALHEIFHVLLGRRDPQRNAHGLEEGLCDLLGSIWLSQIILGRDLTRRLFILNRLSSKYTLRWERYLDTARQAFGIVLTRGLDGTLELLKKGRSALYDIERTLSSTITSQVRADLSDEFISLAWELLFIYPRSFVCSPPAFLFAASTRSGLTVREVAKLASLGPEIAIKAARELRDDHGAVFLRKDEIVILEGTSAAILSKDWFRYESH